MNFSATADHERLNDCLMKKIGPALNSFSNRYEITLRESEILILIAVYGYSNREIADQCMISEKTVKNHIANIMNKLGIKSMRKLLSLLFRYVQCFHEESPPVVSSSHDLVLAGRLYEVSFTWENTLIDGE